MKIHSDFRDYYDIGLRVGVDSSLHYNRKPRWFDPDQLRSKFPSDLLKHVRKVINSDTPSIERVLIGFCGVIYPCIRVLYADSRIDNIYAPEHLDEHFKFTMPKGGRNRENRKKQFMKRQRERAAFLRHRLMVGDDLFIEMDAPIFVVRHEPDDREIVIEANAMLKPYDFAKAVDPFSAFQQVSMYLGNQLVKRDVPDTIADEYRIAMHGYDKHSFRHPTRTSALK
jgi:hypothetical protein